MSVIIAFLTSTIGKYIALAVSAIAAFTTAWLAAKRSGAKAEQVKQAERDAKASAEAKAVDDLVAAKTDEDRRKELAQWQKR